MRPRREKAAGRRGTTRRAKPQRTTPAPLGAARIHVLRHLQVLFFSLGRLSRTPFSTLMTAAVIGIALALPAGLYVVLQNAQQLSQGWDNSTQISVFLKHEVDDGRATALAGRLRAMAEVATVDYISRDQALAEFRRYSGFGDALKALDYNPLPAVLVVRPVEDHGTPQAVERLLDQLQRLPETDGVQLDMQWVKRLYTIMEIGRRGVLVLAVLLGLSVLLVVGNTIRLAIQNQRDEIVITKLIGGTDAFIRRPFLYTGLWYGLLGGIIAWLLVNLSLALLSGPVSRLAGLYSSAYELSAADVVTTLALLLGGTFLGLAGSWLAVGRHLGDIEPS